ncbi:CHAP domain-containing protein [Glaciihabitans arcticus]|uniref:CHAP domain-containing protein n=1 Tax=Glaciihabitans arcticus TaxID=2668039 RepID=UPI001386C307|nr:CHAP domain-containing protein [Glaciihabitans arcticus]
MVSSRSASGVDGLSELFGSVTGEAVEPAVSAESAPLTRRELRGRAAPVAQPVEAHVPDALAWLETPVATEAPVVTTPVVQAPAAPLTRRAARAAEAQAAALTVASVDVPVDAVVAAVTATPTLSIPIVTTEQIAQHRPTSARPLTQPQVPAPEVLSFQPSYAAQVSAVPVKARRAAPPAPRKPLRKKLSSFVTIFAVTGLFASVCLPAYALLPTADADAVVASAASSKVADVSLSVAADAGGLSAERDSFEATTAAELADARSNSLKIANFEAYEASGARELGDDYPWFSELSNNQGGGMSPLNYYYRECVDYVAWKLNVDAGSTKAPFKYTWFDLTPSGGNAYQWKYAWEAHGWATGTTPKAGAVAWFGYHVGYVKQVNSDGTVLIEEYNHQSDHLYGQRTIPASEVTLYLYAPPR